MKNRAVLGILLVATVYFALSGRLTIEWIDEGDVVYPGWLVAQGAIPYRDFGHLYGPSLFFVHGALFALFGADLLVSRIALVVVKLLIVALVHHLATIVADRVVAVGVALILVVIMGSPAWGVFNMPYAHHYALAATLAGIASYLSVRASFLARCAIAGLCFGIASTFKQTIGLFAYLAFGLALASDGLTGVIAGVTRWAHLRQIVLSGFCASAVVGAGFYTKRHLHSWTVVTLLSPLVASASCVAIRALREGDARSSRDGPLAGIVVGGVAFVLPLAGYAAFYGSIGHLRDLVFNTLSGLPQLINWFVALPQPTLRPLLLGVGILLPLAALARPTAIPRWAVLVTTLAVLGLGADVTAGPGAAAYLATRGWEADGLQAVFWILVGLVWVSANSVMRYGIDRRGAASLHDFARGRSARHLVFFFAAVSLLALYPAADEPHALIVLPAFVPLLADQLGRAQEAFPRRWSSAPVRTAILCSSVVLCGGWTIAPFWSLLQVSAGSPTRLAGFPGASALSTDGPDARARLELARRLRADSTSGQDLFVVVNEQMSYFLAGRRSAFDDHEFVFYLVGLGLISAEDARVLVHENALVARLRGRVQVVVVNDDGEQARRYRAAYPEAMRYIEENFTTTERFGRYRILKRVERLS